MLFSLFAAQLVGAENLHAPAVKPAADAHLACLETHVMELEPSLAPYDDIFAASLTDCAETQLALWAAIESNLRSRDSTRQQSEVQDIAIKAGNFFEEGYKDDLRVKFLRARARRAK